MARKKYTPEEILGILRGIEINTINSMNVDEACKKAGITVQTYYRWRKEYGGLTTSQAKRLKELEKENDRLRKAVSDLTLDKLILQEAMKGNY